MTLDVNICHPEMSDLGNILSGDQRYNVPEYQRRYSWKSNEQVEELHQDLITNYDDHNDQKYLLGPIVLAEKEKDQFEIVDGQQRLVTLTLWLCALRDCISKHSSQLTTNPDDERDYNELIEKIQECIFYKNNPRIVLNHNDDNIVFELICHNNKIKKEKNKIATNYKLLSIDISARCNTIILNSEHNPRTALKLIYNMLNSIKSNTSFVVIYVDSLNHVYEIFQSLNSKGQELKQTDLIKSRFLSKSKTKEEKNSIQSKWKNITNNTAIKEKMDDFFYYSMLSRKDKGINIQKKRMYRTIKDLDIKQIQTYMQERCEDTDCYEMLIDPDQVPKYLKNKKYLSEYVHIFYGLKQIKAKYFQRVIIAAWREWKDRKSDEIKILFSCLLKFFFMYRTICKKDIDVIKKIAKEATHAICDDKKSLDQVLDILLKDDKKNPYVTNEEFLEEFRKNTDNMTKDTIKYVLYSIEYQLQMKEGLPIGVHSEYELEHVFPQNPTNAEWPNANQLHEYLDHLGNITLLAPPWNEEIGNLGFLKKKKCNAERPNCCYENSNLKLNKYFSTIKKWDVTEVKNRENELSKIVSEIWNLSEYTK